MLRHVMNHQEHPLLKLAHTHLPRNSKCVCVGGCGCGRVDARMHAYTHACVRGGERGTAVEETEKYFFTISRDIEVLQHFRSTELEDEMSRLYFNWGQIFWDSRLLFTSLFQPHTLSLEYSLILNEALRKADVAIKKFCHFAIKFFL